ncbi:DUF2125 domain-containing protein [Magnetovibrio blakemorei]|uniref:DUF2125 domain-containing protein n=1 Tax=Magnetovibrio blakemorei TaxID=28181 RepID=A0A1E5QC09_9PROT|nr:DUF2125 domain-containing protein [Magnetovibrio blakemorei]OEJ69626.1 hypothetical protein BEN30_01960 [Magnetovibrio blakemorei]
MTYQKPKELQRFQLVVAILASAALVFGLWSFAWYAMTSWAQKEVTDWVHLQRSLGAVVEYASMETSGFPTGIKLTFAEPRYEGAALGRMIKWNSDFIEVSAKPWTPWRLHVNAPGHQQLNLDNGAQQPLQFEGQAKSLVVDAVLGGVWPETLDLRLEDLQMSGTESIAIAQMRVRFSHSPTTQAGGTGISLRVEGDDLNFPGLLPRTLGDLIHTIDLALRVTGAVVPPSEADKAKSSLVTWRDSGGAIEVEHLKFRSGPLGIAAGGTAALDQNLQPEGAFTAKIEGFFQVMEILRAQGIMREGDAVMATMALSALSKRPKDGGAPFMNVSVTVQDSELSVGPLKIMKMPQFDWGLPTTAEETDTVQEPTPTPRDYKDVKPIF